MRTDVNMERLMESLHRTGDIGKTENGGITRPGFSREYEMASKELIAMMKEAGLTVSKDRVGNIIRRREGSRRGALSIMTGSHLDTVTEGGLYDGNLGIISALEAVRMMNDYQVETAHPIEVVAFNAEEGSEMGGTFGSRVMTGRQDLKEKGLCEKLARYGLDCSDLERSIRDMNQVGAFIELHIEQGAYLVNEGCDIGIVDGIVGITRYMIHITGESNHAGTTPMKLRKDPVRAASLLIEKIWDTALRYGHPFVATVGDVRVKPGMYNVIPSEVVLLLELRDLDPVRVEHFTEELKLYGSVEEELKPFGIEFELQVDKPSRMLDGAVINAISEVCQKEPQIRSVTMSSGAGHDSKEIIYRVPAGMIFVPSEGGISHSPREYTTEAQIEKGTRVLYQTLILMDKMKWGRENEDIGNKSQQQYRNDGVN